jgi:hypothetical protein
MVLPPPVRVVVGQVWTLPEHAQALRDKLQLPYAIDWESDPQSVLVTIKLTDANLRIEAPRKRLFAEIEQATRTYALPRLAAGDERSMADKLVRDYFDAVVAGRDVLVVADTWEKADALNVRIQNIYTLTYERDLGHALPAAPIGHRQEARLHDIVMTTKNSWDITVEPDPTVTDIDRETPIITNADRWRVTAIGEDGSISVQRLHDHARAVLPADYCHTSVALGYADYNRGSVTLGYTGTIHAAQGSNAEVGLCIGDADRLHRVAAYPGLTRGTDDNRLYMTTRIAGESEHTHGDIKYEPRIYSDIETQAMFQRVLERDDRDTTALHDAERALQALAAGDPHTNHGESFNGIDPYVAQLAHTCSVRRTQWAHEYAADLDVRDHWEHTVTAAQDKTHDHHRDRDRDRDRGTSYDDLSIG